MTEPTGTRMDLFEWKRASTKTERGYLRWTLVQRDLHSALNTVAAIHEEPDKWQVLYLQDDPDAPHAIAEINGIESESLAKETIETLINLNIAKGRTK